MHIKQDRKPKSEYFKEIIEKELQKLRKYNPKYHTYTMINIC